VLPASAWMKGKTHRLFSRSISGSSSSSDGRFGSGRSGSCAMGAAFLLPSLGRSGSEGRSCANAAGAATSRAARQAIAPRIQWVMRFPLSAQATEQPSTNTASEVRARKLTFEPQGLSSQLGDMSRQDGCHVRQRRLPCQSILHVAQRRRDVDQEGWVLLHLVDEDEPPHVLQRALHGEQVEEGDELRLGQLGPAGLAKG